jgi:hypothetical protein
VLKASGTKCSDDEAWAQVERHHLELGGMLARTWGLPPTMIDVITRHHADDFTSPLLETVRLADRLVALMDASPSLSAEVLATSFPRLTPDQCAELAKQLPLIPPTLDAFRETETQKSGDEYELQVLDEAAVAQRRLLITYEGLVTEAKLQAGSEGAMTVTIPLQAERVVRVNAGDAAFYARVVSSVGESSDLRLWGLDASQLGKWKSFVETGLEDVYSHAAA